jgi:RHS repeat-associated protein
VQANGRNFWVVTERDGTRVLDGLESDHRLHNGLGKISAWYVSKKQDANGNEVMFSYTRDATTHDVRLASVTWADCYRISFTYEGRPDLITSGRPGFDYQQVHRLARIDVEVKRTSNGAYHTYRTYALSYTESTFTGRSLLTQVTIIGINPDGSTHVLPPLTLGYAAPDLANRIWHEVTGALPGASLQDRNLTLVRQSGSGLPDILATTATGHWLRENLGNGRFGSPRRVESPAQVLLDQPGTFISDMSGDGRGDLVVNGGERAYRGVPGGGWGAPYTSTHAPSVDLDASDVRVADLNGDGMPDALRSGTGAWVYFENLGEGLWAPGVTVLKPPAVGLDDPWVHLVDVTGDGLPDLVYMERSRILVWPSQGRGLFGTPYLLGNAPDFGSTFDPRAVRWADMTGSGQADLLYSKAGVVVACFNQAGQALADPVSLASVFQSSHGHVEPVDLLGTGAQGLLFTDQQGRAGAWRYLDLFPAGPPDLLTSIDNGIGATTTLTYTSSAAHWVRDRLAGKPWRTAMPSPQLVVESITTTDTVTGNTLGVSYRYHHGVYDGEEREFRGFAEVEQIDREADADDPQPLSQVLIRRWYHTGFDVELRDEYAPLPERALKADVPKLPWAFRSLRGKLRREETYALDGDPKPYLISETAYQVFPVQRTPGTQRYSFAPLPIHTRTTSTERTHKRRIVETTTTYDLHTGQGYGLPVEVREHGAGRRGTFTTAHEKQQTADLYRSTVTEYVHRDEPDGDYLSAYSPCYLVGKPSQIERYGIVNGRRELLSEERYFYDGEPYQGLGYPGSGTVPGVTHGRLSTKLVLAFTNDLITTIYPASSGARTAFSTFGNYLTVGADHYLHAERYQYDDRGMIIGIKDPDGHESSFEYDATYALFPTKYTDAVGHPTRLTRGELPFQVGTVRDANDNATSFTYDPAGLPESKSVQGKFVSGAWQGDPPTHPTERYSYDFTATPITIVVKTRLERLGATIDVTRYIDGLGRAIQERHTAEPDPNTGATRYRVTGWQMFNHKGLVVKTYQPVFATTDAYNPGDTTTAVIETRYDPLGRPIRVSYPDGTFEATTYHPWIQTVADRNDNAGSIPNSDPRYGNFLGKFEQHIDTPRRTYVDAFGREIAVAEDNGTELHVTRSMLDLKNQITEVWGPRDFSYATWQFGYDLAGRRISSNHVTALGERYALADAGGNAIWARDARAIEIARSFDALNRPLQEITDDSTGRKLRRQWRYVAYDQTHPDFELYQSSNLFGQLEEGRDADGLRFFEYDWRGLVTKVSHRFWSQEDGNGRAWNDDNAELWTGGAAWDPAIPATDRDTIHSWLALSDVSAVTTLVVETTYDAAGRPTEGTYPEGMKTQSIYNAAGLLDRVEVDLGAGHGYQTVVQTLTYNARGQLTYLKHGNGVETTRGYDEALERLTRIFTRLVNNSTTHFQDLTYDYDPVGNPLQITDNLSRSSYTHNQIIPNTRTFSFDPRYRLIRATGKKHRSVQEKTTDVVVPSPDPNDYEPYGYAYAYDAVGNFTQNQEYTSGPVHYKASRIDLFNGDDIEAGSFTDPDEGNFRYDANGNTLHTPHHEELAYTHDNQVRYVNLGGGGQVHYFRHDDQRVLRLDKKNGVKALTVYLGPFEYHWRQGTTSYTKLVLHVVGHGRYAQVERVMAGSDPDSVELSFYHTDHLGSGHVLTKDNGDLLSQEEYFPYGRASDRRDARNRYRFIGVEQDEDTHLYMTGPRAYDPVSGRFLQGDPLAQSELATSPFVYAKANPTSSVDPSGDQEVPPHALQPLPPGNYPTNVPVSPQTPREPFIPAINFGHQPIVGPALLSLGARWAHESFLSAIGRPPHWANSWRLFDEFVSGTGPQTRYYDPNSIEVAGMRASPGIDEALNEFYAINQGRTSGNLQNHTYFYHFSPGLSNPVGWIPAHVDAIQNGTRMFVGGYYASITEITPGSLQVSVWNDTSLNSYAYHALPSHPRVPGQTTRYGTTEQFYFWTVPLDTARLQPGGQAGQPSVSPTTPSAPPSIRQGVENIRPSEWYPAMGTQPVPTE